MKIQITNEITTALQRLQAAATGNADFSRAGNLTFEDNRNFAALTAYQDVIRTVGQLGQRHRGVLVRDIEECNRIIDNVRIMDQQISEKMQMQMEG